MDQPTTHVLESTDESVSAGTLDPSRQAALTIDSGDIVSCPNTSTQWGNQARFGMSFADREPLRRQSPSGPYSNLGPVEVRGAEPGDALESRMLRTKPIDWGWNSFPLGVGALPSDFEEPYVHYLRFSENRSYAEFVAGIRIPLAPSMGVYAVEPEGEEPVSAILAGPYGGNLDLAELTEGTSLFLPVFKRGARVWTGDANAAQSDGVVDQTGIESAMEELRVQYLVRKGLELQRPTIETGSHWIVMAFADSLDSALPNCVRRAIDWPAHARRAGPAGCLRAVQHGDLVPGYAVGGSDRLGVQRDPAAHNPRDDPEGGPRRPPGCADRRLDASSVMTLDAADSLEILQLVARADACATAQDAEGYAALFTEDAVMDGAMGTAHGRAELRDAVTLVWAKEPAARLHLTLNAVIDSSSPEPSVESVMLMVTTDASPAIVGSAKVRQTVTRSPSGWRISSRAITT